MSDVTFYGERGELIVSWQFDLSLDKAGLWRGSQLFYCHKDDMAAVRPKIGDVHPNYDWLKLEGFNVTGMQGEWMEIRGGYVGSQLSGGGSNDPDNPTEYSTGLRLSTGEEHVSTNPYFEYLEPRDKHEAVKLATQPPKNLVADTLKELAKDGWGDPPAGAPAGKDGSKLELYNYVRNGTTHYYRYGVEYYQRYTSTSMPSDLNDIGKVYDSPPDAPNVTGGRNWLLVGYNVTETGVDVYEIEKTWLLSERDGWDENLYSDV